MMQIHKDTKVGDVSNVARLLAQCVAVDTRDHKNRTPLMMAVTSAQARMDIMRLLVNAGADLNAVGEDENYSVLALAVPITAWIKSSSCSRLGPIYTTFIF